MHAGTSEPSNSDRVRVNCELRQCYNYSAQLSYNLYNALFTLVTTLGILNEDEERIGIDC